MIVQRRRIKPFTAGEIGSVLGASGIRIDRLRVEGKFHRHHPPRQLSACAGRSRTIR